MKTSITLNGEKIIYRAKAQAAILALQNPEMAHYFIDDHKELMQIALSNGYMNLCGLLLSYLDSVNFDCFDEGDIELTINRDSAKFNAISFLYCAEQYLAHYILKEMYSASSFQKAEKVCSANFKRASSRLLEFMAL